MKTPILGQAYVARSVNAADNRMVNLYPEATPENGKTAGFLNRAPGLRLLAALGGGPVRGVGGEVGSDGAEGTFHTFSRGVAPARSLLGVALAGCSGSFSGTARGLFTGYVTDKTEEEVVAKVREHFQRINRTIEIDGVRVLFDHGWGLVRASNTQDKGMASCSSRAGSKGRRWSASVPPAIAGPMPGRMPSVTSGSCIHAARIATMPWQRITSSKPPPSAMPLTAATTGNGAWCTASSGTARTTLSSQ